MLHRNCSSVSPLASALLRPALAAGLLLLALAPRSSAQSGCKARLDEAEKAYRSGRFETVLEPKFFQPCLEDTERQRVSREERVEAQRLLALSYLAIDDQERAGAAVENLLELAPEYSPEVLDLHDFKVLVRQKKDEAGRSQVASVSKTRESLREAPATVVVVTAEEIERRGYLDLEQVFHDLPGFDISRGNGDVYSNLYQRGFRSNATDRTLFLVDGVEQNDLHSNTAYISRQYPLSNVDRLEVIYGPASTMYGSNAYTGVISIITKDPQALIEGDKRFGVKLQATSGSLGTSYLDLTLAGRNKAGNLKWSVTGRSYRSDEQAVPVVEGDPPQDVDYGEALSLFGEEAQSLAAFFADFGLTLDDFCRSFCTVEHDEQTGRVSAVIATPEAQKLARALDQRFLEGVGSPPDVSDATDDWMLSAKLRLSGLTLGVQVWRREEGTRPWYRQSRQGGVWTPKQTNLFANYTRSFGEKLTMSYFGRFKQHELDGDTSVAKLLTYADRSLDIFTILLGENFGFDVTQAFIESFDLDQISTQMRNELTLVYETTARFNLVGGIEIRNSSIQGDFLSGVTEEAGRSLFLPKQVSQEYESSDIGIFAQASYRPRPDLKIIAGGRLDNNDLRDPFLEIYTQQSTFQGEAVVSTDFFYVDNLKLRDAVERCGGNPSSVSGREAVSPEVGECVNQFFSPRDFGTVFNPRLAVVYTPGEWVIKAIYAQAFKGPSNFQRFTRDPTFRLVLNPFLEEETVENLELSAGWESGDGLKLEIAAYQADYSDVVGFANELNWDRRPSRSTEFGNIGALRVRGIQASASYRHGGFDLYGNYTFTDPSNTDPKDENGDPPEGIAEVRVGDIAKHRLNLGLEYRFRETLDVALRANYVGTRETGAGTTVSTNPLDEIDSYFVVHGTVSYRNRRLFPGGTLQLVVNNLFDAEYVDPGVQRAGREFAASLLQPGRTAYLRLIFKY